MVSLFSLFGCAKNPSGEIVSASLSVGEMRGSYFYMLQQTEDGVLFSCSDTQGESPVEFEGLPVPDQLLTEFRRAAEDTGFERSVRAGKKSLRKWFGRFFHVQDAPEMAFSLTWENGVVRTASVHPEGEDEIRAFLQNAARIYAPVAEGGPGELDYLSMSAAASWVEGCFSFSVSEKKRGSGDFVFWAEFIDMTYDEASEQWDEFRCDLEEAPLSAEQMARIREAARESGLFESLAAASVRWENPEQDEDEELIPMDATTYSVSASWGGIYLGSRGWGDPRYEPLMSVLREIGRTLSNP